MARISARQQDVRLLAQLMRAEAEGDLDQGMLMVGNVGVNRVVADCLDFVDIRTIEQMIYQTPGGFEAVQKSYFYQSPRSQDIRLAERVIRGERLYPATNALWFYRPVGACPATWYGQQNSGRFKSHCFFVPTTQECPEVY
ncbi:cell wall hydrolase [Numidum massiliense]|uniref:cell wall hydrolase n=1 Tax=Numidum massiliense TaxID=1522315 RepID=UPI0006D5957B|nr:cell wall hydrolase [Numidum massiliense]